MSFCASPDVFHLDQSACVKNASSELLYTLLETMHSVIETVCFDALNLFLELMVR